MSSSNNAEQAAASDPLETVVVSKPHAKPSAAAFTGADPDAPVPFVFGNEIARGGMGSILKADDCKLGRTIAVKVMLSEIDADEDQKQRFVQEAAVLGNLEHPNIVPIHDLGRDSEGQLYYTMKLVKGRTLQAIINDLRNGVAEVAGHYTLARLLTIFRKVCDAMAFAHSRGVIHRDLKPENIMVAEFGEVLVMDWGLAKILKNEDACESSSSSNSPLSSLGATLQGDVMGTPQYMSPEQAEGRVADMDARSDIFSLGGILYAILTLRPPVEGKTLKEILQRVASGSITPPSSYSSVKDKPRPRDRVLDAKEITPLPHCTGGRVPAALSAVVMKALSVRRDERYQDVEAFTADIEAYQTGFATSAENAGAWRQFTLLVKRNRAATIGVAVVLLLCIGFTAKLIAEGHRAERGEAKANAALADLKASAPALLQLAESEADSQRFASALEKLDAALALNPALLSARWQRAWVLLGLERWSEAVDALRLAQQSDSAEKFRGSYSEHPLSILPSQPSSLVFLPSFAPQPSSLSSILPVVERLASSSEAKRWEGDDTRLVFQHLQTVGATGPALALSEKLKLGAAERLKLADQRLLTSLGKGNYAITIENDGLLTVSVKAKPLRSLEAIRGLPIDSLDAGLTQITDLEPLRGMHLQVLDLTSCLNLSGIAPLKGMPLRLLSIGNTPVRDLSPLSGMKLIKLEASSTQLADLSPLAGMPITHLNLSRTPVNDIEVLRGMPLVYLDLSGGGELNCSPLKGAPLQWLSVNGRAVSDFSFAQGMPLRSLMAANTNFSDIKGLRGVPLEYLMLGNAPIDDLTPLQDAPLKTLILGKIKQGTDYSPLLTLPQLERLHCSAPPEQLLPLRNSKKLQAIKTDAYPGEGSRDPRPVAEFWRAYDAHQTVGK